MKLKSAATPSPTVCISFVRVTSKRESQLVASWRTHLALSPHCTLVPIRVMRAELPVTTTDSGGDMMELGGGAGGG
jgi:hypothetical protein